MKLNVLKNVTGYKHALNEDQGDPRNKKSHNSAIKAKFSSSLAILFMILMGCLTPLIDHFSSIGPKLAEIIFMPMKTNLHIWII